MTVHPIVHVVALLLAVVACAVPSDGPGAPVASAEPDHSPGPRPITLPEAVLPDGAVVTLELALTAEERQQGLMYRPTLPDDRGMLFLFAESGRQSIWMKNTLVPLDIVFLDERGTIVDLTANAQPCHADPCPTYPSSERALAVLELAAGSAEKHGLEVGVALGFRRVSGYPRLVEDGLSPPGRGPGS